MFQDKFSKTFLDDFLYLLKRRWGTKRVWNNTVYNEYIMDRDHIHMNATRWLTLSEFTEWLGKEGHCEADYQVRNWPRQPVYKITGLQTGFFVPEL